MKTSWRTELPQLLVIAAMFIAAWFVWPHAPERMPVHWNLHGEADRYGSKAEAFLLLPAITFGLYLLLLLLPRLDPGYANYQRFAKAYLAIRYSLVLVMALLYVGTILWGLGYKFPMTAAVFIVMGMMFIVLGNVMGKIRPNWFVGVRTPWTLSSKLSWDRTHRQAGWLFIVAGLAFILSGILGTGWATIAAFAFVMASALWLVLYSYLVWRRDPDRVPPAGTVPHHE